MSKYKIDPKLAQEIVDMVYESTGYPATVCDENAVMIGDSLRKRLGVIHEGAKRILTGNIQEYFVTADEAAQNPHVKEGYNISIVIDEVKVGTTGIGGKLEVARPLVML